MSEYLEYGGLEEDTKTLQKKVWDFFKTDYEVLYNALHEVYQQAVSDTREKIALEIEATHNPDAFFDGICRDGEYNENICSHLQDAEIARGTRNDGRD